MARVRQALKPVRGPVRFVDFISHAAPADACGQEEDGPPDDPMGQANELHQPQPRGGGTSSEPVESKTNELQQHNHEEGALT